MEVHSRTTDVSECTAEPVFEKAMKKIANDQNIIDVLGPIGNFMLDVVLCGRTN